MNGQHRLLLRVFDGDKPHRGPAHRLADRLGIIAIILAGLPAVAIGNDEARIDNPRIVPQPNQLPGPIVCSRARFQATKQGLIGEKKCNTSERFDFF